jgi:peptide deformylase
MDIKPIKPLLFKKIQGVKAIKIDEATFNKENYKDKVELMIASSDKYDGIGIASVQLGFKEDIIIAKLHGNDNYQVFYNAEIIEYSNAQGSYIEGCLSIPGEKLPVKRSTSILVKYFDGETTQSKEFVGMDARVLQHEIDHNDGITLFDRTILNREHKRTVLNRFKS